jgi:putative drug exporter of the RND superfamily
MLAANVAYLHVVCLSMSTLRFDRLAAWSYRHRWLALVLWLVVLAGTTLAAQTVGSAYHNDHSLPGTESQRVADTLAAHGQTRTESVQIVVRHDGGVRQAQGRITAMLEQVRGLPGVTQVSGPFEDGSAISRDGRIAYATVAVGETAEEDIRRIIDTARHGAGDGLAVELGGDLVRDAEDSTGGPAEGAGLLAALVILVLLFGSLLAASLPIVIAIFAVGSTIGLIVLASNVASVADYTIPLMILVGLGVGIDYALLVFSRYRSELLSGADRGRATAVALKTAGHTVFFAAGTVIIALLGLVVLGLGSLQGVALAVALTVLMTMFAALTLLPALLAIMGTRIERAVRRRATKAHGNRWRRWTDVVVRRPVLATVLSVAGLLALSLPVLDLRLGFADAGNGDSSLTSRKAYDLLADGFGPGFNGPLIVLAEGGGAYGERVRETLAGTPGVAMSTPSLPSPDRKVNTFMVFPTTSPQAAETSALVARLRNDVLPSLSRETGATFQVGGSTAATVDFADAVAKRLPLFIIVVVGLSTVLLLIRFRSLLIPIKAAILNLLSVGAALGVITLVFQHGMFGADPGPIEAFVPVMIFAIAFGLSMDYEMFLLSRMHEEWQRSRDTGVAIREGMATTGGIVTAAAAIMVVVFGAFLLSPDRMLNQFGLGLAVAVLLDAVIIRCLIVPAVMRLFGARAWWLPGQQLLGAGRPANLSSK